jgi:hypothetical protein
MPAQAGMTAWVWLSYRADFCHGHGMVVSAALPLFRRRAARPDARRLQNAARAWLTHFRRFRQFVNAPLAPRRLAFGGACHGL